MQIYLGEVYVDDTVVVVEKITLGVTILLQLCEGVILIMATLMTEIKRERRHKEREKEKKNTNSKVKQGPKG